jgi:hypothetical protein
MDRHSAYVALSRHRDGVQLHYGRDDFADQRQLSARCRARAKDMASDYGHDPDHGRARSPIGGLSGEIRVADAPDGRAAEGGPSRQMGEDPRALGIDGRGDGEGKAAAERSRGAACSMA